MSCQSRQVRHSRHIATSGSRQGVVLLVVLTLLSLFVVICTTFILVASQYNRAAQSFAKEDIYRDPPQKLLDSAFYQIVRGTKDPQSVVRGHDLLGDMYGYFGFRAPVVARQPMTLETHEVDVRINQLEWIYNDQLPSINLETIDFWAGCVITYVDGPLRGMSGRILGSATTPPVIRFEVRLDRDPMQHPSQIVNPLLPEPGNRLVINGRPFTGAGVGYNPNATTQHKLNADALLPNWRNFPLESAPNTFKGYLFGANGVGGAPIGPDMNSGPNEDYDAADYQNMFLAAILPHPTDALGIPFVIPSFHRPELWAYHVANTAPENLPRAIMRPTRFPLDLNQPINIVRSTANNFFPQINLVNGPWDVDNNHDGIPDSIWVDPGFPVNTDKSGRAYKPLIAYLCLDLDGRFNLNYHGSQSHVVRALDTLPAGEEVPNPLPLARNVASSLLPKGSGWGPADINLFHLFWNGSNTPMDIVRAQGANAWLLYGAMNEVAGRYGFPTGGVPFRQPGLQVQEFFSQAKFRGYPLNYFLNAENYRPDNTLASFNRPSVFASPLDLRGQLASGLDPRGAMVTERPPTPVNILGNNPYELNAYAPRGEFDPTLSLPTDQLFSAAELERILRSNDWDAPQLASRLTRIFSGNREFQADVDNDGTPDTVNVPWRLEDPAFRNVITTESWDLPVPTANLRNAGTGRLEHHIVGELYGRLSAGGVPQGQRNVHIERMLGPDLRRGLKLDLNRPFLDINPNAPPTLNLVLPDSPNSRQALARQLYVLMMLFRDPAALLDYDGDGTPTLEETSYAIAQWAINVVDFRDPDSVMTPFEFDINPFNGWNVDGLLGTADDSLPERGLVWGSERPELLISETLAMHDRRSEDLEVPSNRTDDPIDPDDHFDQRLVPQGSLFVELYNPWAGNGDKKPSELYGLGNNPGVQLNLTAPGGAPVWRLMIATTYDIGIQGTNTATERSTIYDPDAPLGATNRLSDTRIERRVYFVPRNTLPGVLSAEPGVHAIDHTVADHVNIAPIMPGRYAMVGPGRYLGGRAGGTPHGFPNIPTGYVTPFGRRTDAIDGMLRINSTRQIRLSPNPNPNVNQVFVLNNERQDIPPDMGGMSVPVMSGGQNLVEPLPNNRQPATAVVINSPPLNVSEPLVPAGGTTGYPEPDDVTLGDEPSYMQPHDIPFDLQRDEADDLNRTGTSPLPVRVVYLQRLANPRFAFHPVTNPYRTIDSSTVFLTAFNGLIDDPDLEVTTTVENERFRTAQRGDADAAPNTPPVPPIDLRRQLWRSRLAAPLSNTFPLAMKETNIPGASRVHNFEWRLDQSFGYLNWNYWPYFTTATAPAPLYVGGPDSSADPREPFPWLKWNNRPFINQLELLHVPATSAFRLMNQSPFGLASSFTTRNVVANPYLRVITTDPLTSPTYGHLLKFFTSTTPSDPAEHFYRLFEFTHVPSRFLGTETFIDTTGDFTDPLIYQAYREPGRVNINTIYDRRVWNAIRNGHPGPSFDEVVASRRGFGDASQGMVDPSTSQLIRNNNLPTVFGNPFRSPLRGDLVPVANMVRADVHTTLMRSDTVEATDPPSNVALMTRYDPSTFEAPNKPFNNGDRNSHFHYAGLQRMGNLVTTRSNVYAVWVTVGFFEVDANGLLGQELGADTGDIERHRAFYILDRSIPVGYEPGENHNVDRAILLRRFIE